MKDFETLVLRILNQHYSPENTESKQRMRNERLKNPQLADGCKQVVFPEMEEKKKSTYNHYEACTRPL